LAPQKLKNSYDARDKLSDEIIPENHQIVSFDVKSLFTSIPHDLALQCTSLAFDSDVTILDRTKLSKNQLLKLIQLCLSASTFKFNEQLYKQLSGLPMGSPVSVVLSEITMQYIEQKIQNEAPFRPLFWYRYVDDCITSLEATKHEEFLEYLNSINTNIQFTLELQQENKIPFLDIELQIKDDRKLSFSVYRKPTNSGKFLDFDSYHHTTHKRNVILSLKNRAKKICSENILAHENKLINEQLKNNGYPKSFLNKTKINTQIQQASQQFRYISAPYIKGASEKIGKLFKQYNIKLSNKSSNTLRRQLCKLKDKCDLLQNSEVIYQVNCNDCPKTYTGETGRELDVRIKEHQRNVRQQNENSLIY